MIAAGYETEMLNDFLPANDGLRRRFPYRIWLNDYTAEELVDIYVENVATALSDPPPAQQLTREAARNFFTTQALTFLTDMINGSRELTTNEGGQRRPLLQMLTGAREATTDGPRRPLLYQLFDAQAGAMVALGSTTALLIESSTRRSAIGVDRHGNDTWALGYRDMRDVMETVLSQQLGPQLTEALYELQAIATEAGWRTAAGSWQVPPA